MSQQIAEMIFAVAFVQAAKEDFADGRTIYTQGFKEKCISEANEYADLYQTDMSARNPKNDVGKTFSEWLSEAECHMDALNTHGLQGSARLAWERSHDPLIWGLEKRRALGMRGITDRR